MAALNSLRVRGADAVVLGGAALPGASACGVAETFPLEGARSLYGASKLCGELLISEYATAYGLRAVINRCGVIAGPWQMGKVDQGVFALWMAAHVFNRPLAYLGWGGTGKQVRDLLHVEDLCELVDRQLTETERFAGQTLNVGGGTANSLSLQETTRLCQQITGRRIAVGSCPENRPADVRLTSRIAGGWSSLRLAPHAHRTGSGRPARLDGGALRPATAGVRRLREVPARRGIRSTVWFGV